MKEVLYSFTNLCLKKSHRRLHEFFATLQIAEIMNFKQLHVCGKLKFRISSNYTSAES